MLTGMHVDLHLGRGSVLDHADGAVRERVGRAVSDRDQEIMQVQHVSASAGLKIRHDLEDFIRRIDLKDVPASAAMMRQALAYSLG